MNAEDQNHTVSSDDSQAKQPRKKRKWDQPAECFVTTGLPFPVILGNPFPVIVGPGNVPILPSPLGANAFAAAPPLPLSGIALQASSVLPKSNQPKAQEELVIAREIIINDADPAVRFKLTKRQTQEEIQRSTGAVVTTRGKYRPPNTPPDGEKPLYLHISAGSHLKETVERIIAVDRAAAMIEEMLKQGPSSQHGGSFLASGDGVKASQGLTTCVYLGFDINPSWNIVSRIRGPNDQYINHIINETGATVSLRGRGSGTQGLDGEEGQLPLHLFLSSTNPKSLENAKNLAEHLLDTISVEFGVSRTSSAKVYAAVPPPQPLLVGALTVGNDLRASIAPPMGIPPVTLVPPPVAIPGSLSGLNSTPTLGPVSLSGMVLSNGVQTQPNTLPPSQPSPISGTRYSGYEGIYPQATPLQQVALVLKHSTTVPTSTTAATVASSASTSSAGQAVVANTASEKDKRQAHRRKFQELPVVSKEPPSSNQESQILKPGIPEVERSAGSISGMLPPKQLGPVNCETSTILPVPKGMPPPPPKCMLLPPVKRMPPPPPPKSMSPPPPPKSMPPPPPPPKFSASRPTKEGVLKNRSPEKITEPIPDTLVKLMEYGEEDDGDVDEDSEAPLVRKSDSTTTPKPFWAV
ncbi:hypothetical protein MLD38_024521 [Melastoma candidum]|uniref:Uncharacterized protein n=1 Tax=Melastoma candidum TaxID=119954 RepID=A0ACB9NSI6_9MYRT|nr:hypothetical protein MLD38_024521 [Melastoma candidum]